MSEFHPETKLTKIKSEAPAMKPRWPKFQKSPVILL